MGRKSNLGDLIGKIKDKASQSKAALSLSSHPKTLTLHLALLRATTHEPFAPPHPKHLAVLLSFGHSSRATASAAIEALMDRLQTTRDASVALKCLVSVHHIIKHGSFILQDQLSVYPSSGGRNYLKLSNFRDNSSLLSWELSSWVRWYALYLELLLSTSRLLGFFLCSSSSSEEKDKEDKLSSLLNSDLQREIDSLVILLEGISKIPDFLQSHENKLVEGIVESVVEDYLSVINEVSVRISEFEARLSCLTMVDSVEFVCAMRKLEDCSKRLTAVSDRKGVLMEGFWALVSEIKSKVGSRNEERTLLSMRRGSGKASESARIDGPVFTRVGELTRFSSARFPGLTR